MSQSSTQNNNHNTLGIQLRGDVLVKCFEVESANIKDGNARGNLLFQCQFNTCALDLEAGVKAEKITFFKEELDMIFSGKIFLIFISYIPW